MRTRVSRSRPCKLGASSLVTLTRVCNAIRSALAGHLGFAHAGPLHTTIIPEVWALPGRSGQLAQGIKLFHDFVELLFALANDARGSFLEGLFARNAIEPALLGELFVAREIETDEQIYLAVGGRSFFFVGFGF